VGSPVATNKTRLRNDLWKMSSLRREALCWRDGVAYDNAKNQIRIKGLT